MVIGEETCFIKTKAYVLPLQPKKKGGCNNQEDAKNPIAKNERCNGAPKPSLNPFDHSN